MCRPRPPAGSQWGPVGVEKCGRCSDSQAEFKQTALTSEPDIYSGEEKLKQLMCGGPVSERLSECEIFGFHLEPLDNLTRSSAGAL